jgi:c-di-GMP-binding flagellar brake protein YcgR
MFEKSFAFWRRLLGKPLPVEEATAVDDDRRRWARYAADVPSKVQLEQQGHHDKIQASIRDLSQGGVNLLVEHPLPAGQMLSLELPADKDEVRTVLACVVRATREDGDKWSLGCVFSRELAQEDLERFGEQAQASHADKRVWVRYECMLQADCRRISDPDAAPQRVHVLNISASGIGLALPAPVESGALLTLDLLDKDGRQVCTILACAVHTAQHAGDCAVGCNFIRELSEDELQSLL